MLKRRSFTLAALAYTARHRPVRDDVPRATSLRAPVLRRGFTMLELMVVLVVAGVLVAITGQQLSSAFSGNSRSSASRMAGAALFQARAIAIQRSRTATLVRNGNTIMIFGDSLGTRVQLGKTLDLSQRYSVTLAGTSPSPTRDSVMFDSRGLLIGTVTPYSIIVTKGTKSDTVCMSGLGNTRGRGC